MKKLVATGQVWICGYGRKMYSFVAATTRLQFLVNLAKWFLTYNEPGTLQPPSPYPPPEDVQGRSVDWKSWGSLSVPSCQGES